MVAAHRRAAGGVLARSAALSQGQHRRNLARTHSVYTKRFPSQQTETISEQEILDRRNFNEFR